jgi:hypothetical protein
LIAGNYKLVLSTPNGMKATVANLAVDSLDSDVVNDTINNIVLTDNTIDSSFDAGYHNVCSGIIRGYVWHDTDGMNDNYVDSAGFASSNAVVIPNGLKIVITSFSTGHVVKTVNVTGLNTFTITNIPTGSYYLTLTTIAGIIGQNPPNSILPMSWRFTGEKLGLGPGRDPQINGKLNVFVAYECVYNAQFGIAASYTCASCID